MSWFLSLAAKNQAAAVVGLQVAEVFHAKRLAELLCGVKPGREEAGVELGPLLIGELQGSCKLPLVVFATRLYDQKSVTRLG